MLAEVHGGRYELSWRSSPTAHKDGGKLMPVDSRTLVSLSSRDQSELWVVVGGRELRLRTDANPILLREWKRRLDDAICFPSERGNVCVRLPARSMSHGSLPSDSAWDGFATLNSIDEPPIPNTRGAGSGLMSHRPSESRTSRVAHFSPHKATATDFGLDHIRTFEQLRMARHLEERQLHVEEDSVKMRVGMLRAPRTAPQHTEAEIVGLSTNPTPDNIAEHTTAQPLTRHIDHSTHCPAPSTSQHLTHHPAGHFADHPADHHHYSTDHSTETFTHHPTNYPPDNPTKTGDHT